MLQFASRVFVTLILLLPNLLQGQRDLKKVVADFVEHESLANASIGIDIIDLNTGKRLAAFDPNRSLIPASTQKLLTTGAALDLMGAESTFVTKLAIDGRLENGVLHGNLFIIGGGDPSLASDKLREATKADQLMATWVDAISKSGIRDIQGYVVADANYYPTHGIPSGWPWADIGNYYGAGAYGLNWHENYYYLDFLQRQRLGTTPPVQRIRPAIPGLKLHNEIRTAGRGSGDNAYIYGAPFNFDNYIRGTIPAGTGRFTIKGSIPDPPLLVAQLLQEQLEAIGIKTLHPATSSRELGVAYSGEGIILHEHHSPPLSSIVSRTNLQSINLYAETLVREINKRLGKAPHELTSTKIFLDYFEQQLQLDISGVNMNDGSGLGTRNYFPPSFMTAFLKTKDGNNVFLNSIPKAGSTGGLRNRFRGTAAEGKLYAKSGYVSGARCYAGYAFPKNGRRLAFAIMVNNYTIKTRELNQLLFRFMQQLCE